VLEKVTEGLWSTSGFKRMSYLRIGERTDGQEGFQFIDPDGGPYISIGQPLPNGETISNIVFEDGRYLIKTNKYVQEDNTDESQDRDKIEE
jgi:hypothetical protein